MGSFLCGLYEVKLRKQKWLMIYSYYPNKSMIIQHMETLAENMDLYSSTYENFNFLDAGMEHSALKDFYYLYSLTGLINRPTCWKNPSKPTCIDLILKIFQIFFRTPMLFRQGHLTFIKGWSLYWILVFLNLNQKLQVIEHIKTFQMIFSETLV